MSQTVRITTAESRTSTTSTRGRIRQQTSGRGKLTTRAITRNRVLCAIFPLLVRELDERLGLSSLIAEHLTGDRRGKLRHYYRLNNGGAGDLRVQCFPFRSQKGNLC